MRIFNLKQSVKKLSDISDETIEKRLLADHPKRLLVVGRRANVSMPARSQIDSRTQGTTQASRRSSCDLSPLSLSAGILYGLPFERPVCEKSGNRQDGEAFGRSRTDRCATRENATRRDQSGLSSTRANGRATIWGRKTESFIRSFSRSRTRSCAS